MTEQRTPEWFAKRLGKVTGSRISDLTAKLKNGASGAACATYMAEKVVERLTGVVAESGFVNAAMLHGSETEPKGRSAYQWETMNQVELIDFVDHPTIPMAGASPDGYVGTDGLVEIKCPTSATHIDTLLGGSIPGRYISQIQWQLACTGRKWCDWVSYDPRLPESMQLFIKRLQRDDKHIAEIEAEVRKFLVEVDAKVAELTRLYPMTQEAAA